MEKGHEGDEIVLLSFRQSGFSISPHIKSLEDLNADEFVSILSQSLVLITSGELQVSNNP